MTEINTTRPQAPTPIALLPLPRGQPHQSKHGYPLLALLGGSALPFKLQVFQKFESFEGSGQWTSAFVTPHDDVGEVAQRGTLADDSRFLWADDLLSQLVEVPAFAFILFRGDLVRLRLHPPRLGPRPAQPEAIHQCMPPHLGFI